MGILMSIHNIGFDEDLTKNIFQLLSNIIKYLPYLFFNENIEILLHYIYEPRYEKTGFLHMRKQRHRSASR